WAWPMWRCRSSVRRMCWCRCGPVRRAAATRPCPVDVIGWCTWGLTSGMAGCGSCGEQPFQCGDALVEVGLQAGLDGVGEVFHEAASGVEGDAVMESCCVACLVAGQGGGQRGRAEVAVEEGEVAGGVGECGVAPVDDAGDCLSGRADQDMLDSQIIVGEHQAV